MNFPKAEIFPCQTMYSHIIPNSSDENETGAFNDPTQNKNSCRFHTGLSLSSDKQIRRAGEQTSPQVARAAGLPR
jgi:hypothetical protein